MKFIDLSIPYIFDFLYNSICLNEQIVEFKGIEKRGKFNLS